MNILDQIRLDREETIKQRNKLLAGIADLDAKLGELDAALRTLDRYGKPTSKGAAKPAPKAVEKPVAKTPPKPAPRIAAEAAGASVADGGPNRGAKRRRVERALEKAYPKGLTIAELREAIMADEKADVSVNTITVTLSRMRDANLVKVQGRLWSLVRKPGRVSA